MRLLPTIVLIFGISANAFANQPDEKAPKNVATALLHHCYPVVPFYIANVHVWAQGHDHPITTTGRLIKLASAIAAGKEMASAVRIVDPDSAAAHGLTAFGFLVIGARAKPNTIGDYMRVAAVSEVGQMLVILVKENVFAPLRNFSTGMLGFISLGRSLYITQRFDAPGLIRFPRPFDRAVMGVIPPSMTTTAMVLVSTQMAMSDYLPQLAMIGIALLPLEMTPHARYPLTIAMTHFAAGHIIRIVEHRSWRRALAVKISLFTMGAGSLFSSSTPSGRYITPGRAAGLMLPLALDFVEGCKAIVTSLYIFPGTTGHTQTNSQE